MNKIKIIIYALSICIVSYLIIKRELNQSNSVMVMDKPTTENSVFGGDFALQKVTSPNNTQPKPFHLTDLRGKYVLLYFGYTYCPDVCPLGLSNIGKAIQLLKRDRDQFVPVFITVDPKRDTPDILNLYASNFDPAFIFLWGSEDHIESVKTQYKVYSKKETTENGANPSSYLINHSSYIYILDREGKFIQNIPHDMPFDEMNKVFVKILSTEQRKS